MHTFSNLIFWKKAHPRTCKFSPSKIALWTDTNLVSDPWLGTAGIMRVFGLNHWCTDMEILQSWSNPKLFQQLHIQSISENIKLWTRYPIQIRNRSINCTLANIIGIVYFASRGKNCGYFASCQTKVVEVVTWQVGYDTQKTRARVWDRGKC